MFARSIHALVRLLYAAKHSASATGLARIQSSTAKDLKMMNVSFNGARRNLARSYNEVARDPSPDNLNDLRNVVVAFLCMFDDNINGDFDDLIDEVKLVDYGCGCGVLEETEEFGG